MLEIEQVSQSSRLVAAGYWQEGAICPHCERVGVTYEAWMAVGNPTTVCKRYSIDTAVGMPLFYCYSLCEHADGTEHPVKDVEKCEDCDKCPSECDGSHYGTCDNCGTDLNQYGECGYACVYCADCETWDACYCGDDDDYYAGCDCEECQPSRSSGLPDAFSAYAEKVSSLDSDHWTELTATWAQIDPAGSMATFYLHHWMRAKTDYLAIECAYVDQERLSATRHAIDQETFDAMISHLDSAFQTYLAVAIGGELRHHRQNRSLNGSRTGCYRQWLPMVELMEKDGFDVWGQAAKLFRDGSWSAGYGGEAWAIIADVLRLRKTGRLSPELFIDRVFNLQHNGGSALNKVAWAQCVSDDYSSPDACEIVGNAHAAADPDLPTLLTFAGGRMRETYSRWIRSYNKARVSGATRVCRFPQMTDSIKRVTHSWTGQEYPALITNDGYEIRLVRR